MTSTKLRKLTAKRAQRVKSRKHHAAKGARFQKAGKKVRAAYQFRRMRAQMKAIKKLDWLIHEEEKHLEATEINWNGHAPVGGPNLRRALRYALNHFDVYVTSTNGGSHTSTSYHYRNEAVDIGANSTQAKIDCQVGLYTKFGAAFFAELFGPDNYPWVKDGRVYTTEEGTALENLHDTHVHMAVTS